MSEDGRLAAIEARLRQLEGMLSGAFAVTWQAPEEDLPDGGGGEPGAVMGESGAFRMEDGWVKDCHFMFARRVYTIDDAKIGDGRWFLVVPHDNPRNARIASGSGESTDSSDTQTGIPLFVIENGSVTADYRGLPCIPVYE